MLSIIKRLPSDYTSAYSDLCYVRPENELRPFNTYGVMREMLSLPREGILREEIENGYRPMQRSFAQQRKQRKIEMGRFIDPLTDWGFRHLFGREAHKDILIAFLNDLFQGSKEIRDVTFANNERDADSPEHKRVVFDLHCTGADGELFIVEMQRIMQEYFFDRSLYYVSRLIQDQIPRGAKVGYRLPEIYLIAILDFALDPQQRNQYFRNIMLTDQSTGSISYHKLAFKLLEIANFDKSIEQLENSLDHWTYLLKNMHAMDEIGKFRDIRIFSKIFDIAKIANLKEEEKMTYQENWMIEMDQREVMEWARKEGLTKGKLAVAKNLIAKLDLSDEQIAELAGLPVEEIQKLR